MKKKKKENVFIHSHGKEKKTLKVFNSFYKTNKMMQKEKKSNKIIEIKS